MTNKIHAHFESNCCNTRLINHCTSFSVLAVKNFILRINVYSANKGHTRNFKCVAILFSLWQLSQREAFFSGAYLVSRDMHVFPFITKRSIQVQYGIYPVKSTCVKYCLFTRVIRFIFTVNYFLRS